MEKKSKPSKKYIVACCLMLVFFLFIAIAGYQIDAFELVFFGILYSAIVILVMIIAPRYIIHKKANDNKKSNYLTEGKDNAIVHCKTDSKLKLTNNTNDRKYKFEKNIEQLYSELKTAEEQLKFDEDYLHNKIRAGENSIFAEIEYNKRLKIIEAIKIEIQQKKRVQFTIKSLQAIRTSKELNSILLFKKKYQDIKEMNLLNLKLVTEKKTEPNEVIQIDNKVNIKNIGESSNNIEKKFDDLSFYPESINCNLKLNEIEFDGFSVFTDNKIIKNYIDKYKYKFDIRVQSMYGYNDYNSFVSNNSYVKKGDLIFEINCNIHFKNNNTGKRDLLEDSIKFYAPKDGYIQLYKKNVNILTFTNEKENILFSIWEDKYKLIDGLCYNDIDIKTDDFNKEKHLFVRLIGNQRIDLKEEFSKFEYNHYTDYYFDFLSERLFSNLICLSNHDLGFTLENISGKDYIKFIYNNNEYRLNENDKFLFLLANKEIVEIVLKGKPEKIDRQKRTYLVPLTIEHIEMFKISEIEQVRIELLHENFKKDFSFDTYLGYITQKLFVDYHNAVISEFEDYKPLSKDDIIDVEENNQPNNEKCYVYLMVDTVNNYHKIGISNKPEYRENTLQSEKPSIELICFKKYPSRLIAKSIEKSLHTAFQDKRVRGEWFNLNEKDIDDIAKTLS